MTNFKFKPYQKHLYLIFPCYNSYLLPEAEAKQLADDIFVALIPQLNNSKVSGPGRDNIMEFMIKFITRKDGVGWSMKFVEFRGKLTTMLVMAC